MPTEPPTQRANSFSPELKASIIDLMGFSAENRVCRRLVDLHVENASLAGVIARLRQILPTGSLHIEVRDDTPIKASLDLKQVKVGDALSDLARLAGCRLYVLPDTLLIAPEAKLSPGELHAIGYSVYNGVGYFSNYGNGTEWLRGGGGGASGSKARNLFARAIAQEATGQDTTTDEMRGLVPATVETTFGAFSPESQAMIQELANYINEGPPRPALPVGFSVFPVSLTANTPVTIIIPNPGQITLSFPPNPVDALSSNSKAVSRGLGIMWNER